MLVILRAGMRLEGEDMPHDCVPQDAACRSFFSDSAMMSSLLRDGAAESFVAGGALRRSREGGRMPAAGLPSGHPQRRPRWTVVHVRQGCRRSAASWRPGTLFPAG